MFDTCCVDEVVAGRQSTLESVFGFDLGLRRRLRLLDYWLTCLGLRLRSIGVIRDTSQMVD